MSTRHLSIIGMATAMAVTAISLSCADATALTPAASEPGGEVRPSRVVNPTVPAKTTFAGKTVDLDANHMWERLDRELTAMTYTHGSTLLTLKRANRWFPVLAPILKKNGVPADLIYLAVVESTLNPRAVSPAKAGGLWQFIPSTAKEYGLEVNDYVDERFDPVKATDAACRYLKKAYSKYGKWESVAASYNAGQTRISNELESQGADTAYDLWLPEETMRYMYRLLATKMLMENPARYGFELTPEQLYQPVEYRYVEVSGPVDDWQIWAKENGTDYYTVREHNPWIRSKQLPNKQGKTYRVAIPKAESLSRSRQAKSVYNPAWVTLR